MADTTGRAVREVLHVVREPERRVFQLGLDRRRSRRRRARSKIRFRAQTLDQYSATVRAAKEHRGKILAPKFKGERTENILFSTRTRVDDFPRPFSGFGFDFPSGSVATIFLTITF